MNGSRKLQCILCILVLLSSGCVKKEIIDDINLIEAMGFDYVGGGKIRGTILYPIYQPDQPPKDVTLTAEHLMKKTILQDIQLQSPNPIVTGSMEVILFSKELSEKEGVLELVDAFQRDPGVGSRLFPVIVDGDAQKLLEGEYGIKGNATFIADLVKNNIEQEDLPKTNLQQFLFDYYQIGKTPFMPQLKQISKDKLELNGVGFFRYGKIVETISSEEMFFFKLLVDKYSNGMHRVTIDDDEAAVRDITSKHNFELTGQEPVEITVKIRVNGIINEFTGNELTPKRINKLEKNFEEKISKECLALFEKFREKGIDPVGFGHYYKTQTKKFDYEKWTNSQYENLRVKIEPDVIIKEAGVIE